MKRYRCPSPAHLAGEVTGAVARGYGSAGLLPPLTPWRSIARKVTIDPNGNVSGGELGKCFTAMSSKVKGVIVGQSRCPLA
jgi:hypothetical protein